MKRRARPWLLLLICLVLVALATSLASARSASDVRYTLAQTYSASLRMLRVDLGLEVTEKDPEAAYLLFRYRVPGDAKRVVDGAIELVTLDQQVRIVVKLPELPELHERLIRDRLLKKLRDEYGEPRPVAPAKPREPPVDGGVDGGPSDPAGSASTSFDR